MSGLKRHVGRLKNTDRKIVVIYMEIPGAPGRALIIDTDALPDQFHEFLMNVVESDMAQNTVNLADVLDRRASPDSGMNLMNSLHRRGFMRPEPISNIVMFPRPNMPFPLSQIIELTKQAAVDAKPPTPVAPSSPQLELTENMQFENQQQAIDVAQNILFDAQLLEEEVIRKRKQAYKIAPSLKPEEPTPSLPDNWTGIDTFSQDLPLDDEEAEILSRAQEHLERSSQRQERNELDIIPLPRPKRAPLSTSTRSNRGKKVTV